jgi:thioredoxin reductase (NADPH)
MEKVVIIGGGPAGLSAAIYLARAGLSPLVFAGSPPGGQLMLTSEVENYPGYESILGPQLIEKMRTQASRFGAKIIDQNITKIDLSQSPFKVYLNDSARHRDFSTTSPPKGGSPKSLSQNQVAASIIAKSLIIATGAKALWLNVSGEERLRGKGVSACATCDGFFFKDKAVAVVGGGDTAMEEALTLSKFAKEVYLIHRRDSFRASKIMQERVFKNPKIKIIYNAVVEEILGKQKVEGIRLKNFQFPISNFQSKSNDSISNENYKIENLKVDGLFVAIGHKPDTDIFAGQIELDEKGYVITSARVMEEFSKLKILTRSVIPLRRKNAKLKITIQNEKLEKIISQFNLNFNHMTSKEGVFAAGDCVDFRYRQAATAAGSGVEAALEVERWLEEQ